MVWRRVLEIKRGNIGSTPSRAIYFIQSGLQVANTRYGEFVTKLKHTI